MPIPIVCDPTIPLRELDCSVASALTPDPPTLSLASLGIASSPEQESPIPQGEQTAQNTWDVLKKFCRDHNVALGSSYKCPESTSLSHKSMRDKSDRAAACIVRNAGAVSAGIMRDMAYMGTRACADKYGKANVDQYRAKIMDGHAKAKQCSERLEYNDVVLECFSGFQDATLAHAKAPS